MLADGTIRQAIPVALPKAFAAGLTGLTDGGTLGVSTIGVKLVAMVYDSTGSFAPLWLTLAGCAAFVAVAGLFLPGRLRRAPVFIPQPAH